MIKYNLKKFIKERLNLLDNDKGFTLIEAMVALFIFVLVVAAVNNFIIQNYKSYQISVEQSIAIEEGREAIESMVKEIREVKSSDAGHYPIAEANNDSFTFYGDIDRDVAVEKVRYFRDGNIFKKGVIEPTGEPLVYDPLNEQITIISENLISTTTPIFLYYNGDYPGDTVNNPLETPADVTEIKLIQTHIIINVDPDRPPLDYILDTFIQPRNLKDNL
jgi:prepilin-type N-terminal cleavage/methylation domain-containing protein